MKEGKEVEKEMNEAHHMAARVATYKAHHMAARVERQLQRMIDNGNDIHIDETDMRTLVGVVACDFILMLNDKQNELDLLDKMQEEDDARRRCKKMQEEESDQ